MGNNKRALIVGIDHYHSPLRQLKACIKDAERMQEMLGSHANGKPNFACKLMISSKQKITRLNLRKEIENLFLQPADVALLYFAGHGAVDKLGGYLITQDYHRYDPGISMADLLTLANQSESKEVVIMIDSCKSGELGELPILNNDLTLLREGVTIITATSPTQLAEEKEEGGLFTTLVYEALKGGAADLLGNVTVFSVYAYVDQILGAWEQAPMFKSSMSRVINLRECVPQVERSVLRKLPVYFSGPTAEHKLSPAYEPTAKPKDEEKEQIFAELQALRAISILKPVGEEHMYYAAINNKSCRLTPLGRFYWRLAKERKF